MTVRATLPRAEPRRQDKLLEAQGQANVEQVRAQGASTLGHGGMARSCADHRPLLPP